MSFLQDLSHADLLRLRKIVRRAHMRYYPTEILTDHEADRIIESFGEQTRQKLLKEAIDRQAISTPGWSRPVGDVS